MPESARASIEDVDRKHVFHPFTALRDHESTGARVMVEGKGCSLTDSAGKQYLDAMAGLWCVNIGYGNVEMAQSLSDSAAKLGYYHAFSSMGTAEPALLAERLIGMAPVPMSKVFFGNSGSDANDTNAKLIWYYNNALGRPSKKKIISRQRGYHGVTVLATGLTGLPAMHAGFDVPLPMIRHTRAPHRLWEAKPGMSDEDFALALAGDLEDLILAEGPDTVAAFIAEPIQAAGGVVVPPAGYFSAVHEVLRKYDVLLIADEVVCGFGRLGVPFGTTMLGMEPDLITVAKGITSAYVPLSASLVSEKIWRVLADSSAPGGAFGHGYTYSCHPLAAAAALTNLDIIERDGLVDRAASMGEYLQDSLREAFAGHPMVGEVRGRGLIAAVEFVRSLDGPRAFDTSERVGARVTKRCLDLGVITRALPAADTIAFSPPFVVTTDEIDRMVQTARQAADEVAVEVGLA